MMQVFILTSNGIIYGVFARKATLIRALGIRWPNAEQADDLTWIDGSVTPPIYINSEEHEFVS